MRKATIGAALLLASTSALAGSLNFDARFDSDHASFNTDYAKPAYTKYFMNVGRVDYKGKLTDDINFRLRLRFDKSPVAVNANDNLNQSVDLAYVSHKMGDFTLTAGKFDIGMNGFEGLTPGPDIYFKSQAYSIGTRYLAGFSGSYAFGDHSITLLTVNNTADQVDSSGSLTQTAGYTGLIFKGAFLDKALTPLLSYHKVNPVTSGNVSVDGFNTYTTLGLKYDVKTWNVAFDYSTFATESSADATKSDTLNSMVLTFGYNIADNQTVKAKVESSTAKLDKTGVSTAYSGTGLTYEYKPAKDADFRYHVAYTTQTNKADSTNAVSKTENHLIAGIRINADFLK